jgi:hypothetical protein
VKHIKEFVMIKQRKRTKPVTTPNDTEPALPRETTTHEEEKKVEELPSVEWGERLGSGKAIARGGRKAGYVPGASPAHPS